MKIAVLGAGAAGAAITDFLTREQATTAVTVIDRNGSLLQELEARTKSRKLRVHRIGMEKENAILSLIKGYDCIISALPYSQNYKMASMAVRAGIHYVDLGGDDETMTKQFGLFHDAKENNVFVVPSAGFAPGMVNILAMHGVQTFDEVDSLTIRAAAIPKNPEPPLKFHRSFSPLGLINEYLNKVPVIENGKLTEKNALDGHELFTFASRPELGELEAFYVSGTASVLSKRLEGKVKEFNFKTLRYPGHRDIMKTFFALGFDSEQIIDIQSSITYKGLFVRQLQRFLPQSKEDIALAQITVRGKRYETDVTRTYELNLDSDPNSDYSAMMTCTAWSAVQTGLLIASGTIDSTGGVFVPEDIVPRKEYIEFMKAHGVSVNISDKENTDK
jgi:lysine 6-dehydrogenase